MALRFLIVARSIFVVAFFFRVSVLPADESFSDLSNINPGRFVAVGRLALAPSEEDARPEYVLVDDQGQLLGRLKSAGEVNLSEHLGEEVGVTARMLADGDVPLLMAERITLFGERRQSAETDAQGDTVSLVAHQEELIPTPPLEEFPEMAVPRPGREPHTVGPPAMDDPYFDHACPGCRNSVAGPDASCPCGPRGRLWLRSELLGWWGKGMDVPPLVTTSLFGTPSADAGVWGRSGTSVVYGNDKLLTDGRGGSRYRLGAWLDACQWIGLESDFLFLFDENDRFHNTEIGELILARPFFDVVGGVQASELVQYPGMAVGTVHVDSETRLWTIGPRFRINLACDDLRAREGSFRLDALVGYRYVRLEDNFRVHHRSIDLATQEVFDVRDAFDSSNDFHGGDIGLLWERYRGPWSLELIGRVGVGNNHQKVRIRGQTTTTMGGASTIVPVGFLASGSNRGSFSRDRLIVIPELSATVGYAVTPQIRLVGGYTFLYWSRAVRAGDQVDLSIGGGRPAFAFNETSFWAQGLNVGLDYRW